MKTRRTRLALDIDTAMEDGQWEKLEGYLADILDDDQMKVVEEICRGGGDAPEDNPKPGADRWRSSRGASDSAIGRMERHKAEVREKHRRGLISDVELPRALASYGDITAASKKPVAVPYDPNDTVNYPHARRLK